jgi:hypothetical protein
MKAQRLSNQEYTLCISDDEFRVLVNAMRELCLEIPDFEFYARVGCSKEVAGRIGDELWSELQNVGIEL